MMDGDTIGSEENTVESETFVAHAIKNEWSEMAEQFPDVRWYDPKTDKLYVGHVFTAPGSGDTMLIAHGQSIPEFYEVKYTEKFHVSGTSKDGFVHVDPTVTGYVDCTMFTAIPQLREAIHTHQFNDDDARKFIAPFTSNIVMDYVTEYNSDVLRVTFVNGHFTKVETNISLDNITFVNRYHFEADDVKTEVFRKINDEWVVEASSETTIKAGVELG